MVQQVLVVQARQQNFSQVTSLYLVVGLSGDTRFLLFFFLSEDTQVPPLRKSKLFEANTAHVIDLGNLVKIDSMVVGGGWCRVESLEIRRPGFQSTTRVKIKQQGRGQVN